MENTQYHPVTIRQLFQRQGNNSLVFEVIHIGTIIYNLKFILFLFLLVLRLKSHDNVDVTGK